MLIYTVERSTRTSGPPVVYQLKKAGWKQAYVLTLEDNWEIGGKLPVNAIPDQPAGRGEQERPAGVHPVPRGLAVHVCPFGVRVLSRHPKLFVPGIEVRGRSAITTLKQYVKGYVVWDKNVRNSLIVAFTVAGLESAVVVSEELIPMVEKAGLKPVEDFRGTFTGQTDTQIYTWAYQTSTGPVATRSSSSGWAANTATVMKPRCADWGI